MAEPITLFHTEEMQFEKKGEGKEATIMISGNAQPLNEDSRNGVRYRPDSVKKAAKSLQGVAFLFNHDSARSLGHVTKSGLTDSHLTYSADVDPEEKEYIRKVERGDIKFVSVGCMVENVQFNEEDNIYECDVKEYVELSAVTVPGFSNTSAEKEGLESAMFLANALGDKKVLQSLKEKAALDAVGKKEDSEEESPEGEGSEEAKDDDKEDEADDDDDDDEKDKDESADGDEGSEEGTEEAEAEETDEEGKEALIGKKEEADSEGEEQADEEATPEERITELENKVSELESKNDEFEMGREAVSGTPAVTGYGLMHEPDAQKHSLLMNYIGGQQGRPLARDTMKGGYDCHHTPGRGITTIEGNINISDGTVETENIVIAK